MPTRDYLLGSIRSWTTTEPSPAVPTGSKALPVCPSRITSRRSDSRKLSPAGFEFAVIEDDGDVVFHSDSAAEHPREPVRGSWDPRTGGARGVAAHIDEHLDLLYAGRSDRAYVMRLGAARPWLVSEAGWAPHTSGGGGAGRIGSRTRSCLAALFGLCFFTGNAGLAVGGREAGWPIIRMLSLCSWLFFWSWAAWPCRLRTSSTLVLLASIVLPLLAWPISYLVVPRPPRRGEAPAPSVCPR